MYVGSCLETQEVLGHVQLMDELVALNVVEYSGEDDVGSLLGFTFFSASLSEDVFERAPFAGVLHLASVTPSYPYTFPL